MSEIISIIKLCSVPTRPVHQLYMSKAEQEKYFESKVKHTYTDCKYTARNGKLRVRGYVDTLNDVNYGFYKNEYNGTVKTYYFWIVEKNAVSKEVTELTIALDVFQTWVHDIRFNQCFVEREHVNDDTFGLHTFGESFELGDYTFADTRSINETNGDVLYCLAVSEFGNKALSTMTGKLMQGYGMIIADYDHLGNLQQTIQSICDEGKADSIISLFTFPKKFFPVENASFDGTGATTFKVETNFTRKKYHWNGKYNGVFTGLKENYVPKNNKCFCYPFNFLTVTSPNGSNVVLKFENFSNPSDINFVIDGTLTLNPRITCTPLGYTGKSYSYEDSLEMGGFGLCSWNNDTFSNWYAQNSHTLKASSINISTGYTTSQTVTENNYANARKNAELSKVQSGFNTGVGVVQSLFGSGWNIVGGIANAVGTGVSGVANMEMDYNRSMMNANNDLRNASLLNLNNYESSMRSLVASVQDANVLPNTCKGDTSADGLDVARESNVFRVCHSQVKVEYIKIVDMYFQMYGYKVNEVKKPSLLGRKKWKFLKTVGSNCTGNIPQADLDAINALFDNGFTVWYNENDMYKFDVANPIETVIEGGA